MATKLKIRTLPRFLSSIFAGTGTAIRKDGLATYIDLNWSLFGRAGSYDPSAQQVLIQSTLDSSFQTATIAQLISASQTQQIKTSAGSVNVAANDGLIILNKTVGAATTVNLPASSNKVGPVKIVDWKGDAGTNNITIALVGSDKLNGNLTTWTIAADGASVVCTPLSDGSGYAV
jgi:hypothetical protein